MTDRYDYAAFGTKERAQSYLEEMFATGDVMEGEQPRIESRRGRLTDKLYYVISIAGE